MLQLLHRSYRHRSTVSVASGTRSPHAGAPVMRSAAARRPPAAWPSMQRAPYYFDAGWHTAQTLRRLMRANLAVTDLGLGPAPGLLAHAMDALLHSICPGLPDDHASLDCFRRLLHSHLAMLGDADLGHLQVRLKESRFGCAVVESVIDDAVVEEYGFANGPPHRRQRTLMFTADLHDALETARATAATDEAAYPAQARLARAQAQSARDVLAAVAERHERHTIALADLVGTAAQLAQAIGLPAQPAMVIAAVPLPPVSQFDWQEDQLIVELNAFAALVGPGDRNLQAELMRDLLELLLARKLFGMNTDLMTLSPGQRAILFDEVERVLSLPPTLSDPDAARQAAAVLAGEASFGTVQVHPTAGVTLGHAWIAPSLSAMPDKARKLRDIGTRYMRSGFRLEPVHCTVNEWEMRWLSAKENEALYPAELAWHLRVPAHWLKLQQAAAAVMEEWRREALPYRFIGTEPGMPATGCRKTVWIAVQKAMDSEAHTLFRHFVRGLPEPESPTELALRIEQFMQWLRALAARNKDSGSDL